MAGDVQGVLQVVDHRGVQVAAAGAHHQAGQRGHAHGGIHHLALIDCGDGGTVAQMAGDQLQIFNVNIENIRSSLRNIAVACSVEAVSSYFVFLIIFMRQTVKVCFLRHCLMESSIKYTNHRHVWH